MVPGGDCRTVRPLSSINALLGSRRRNTDKVTVALKLASGREMTHFIEGRCPLAVNIFTVLLPSHPGSVELLRIVGKEP